MESFSSLGLNTWILRQLETLGIKKPTPIQEKCIPEILKGRDCIGAAKTGSGKTLAFALPILQELSEDPYGIFALVLTPTRELAYQISETFSVIGKCINLRQSVIIGGMDMIAQGKQLSSKPHIVVGTPGRIVDHLESSEGTYFKKVKFLVLDEADRLLGGAYDSSIKRIFEACPKSRQILLFSATMTDTLEQVKAVTKSDVFQWEQKSEVATVEELEQYYVLCPGYVKDGYLVETISKFLEMNKNASIIVFTDTCKNCQLLSMILNESGFENAALHGMISQKERLNSLTKFKSKQLSILLATDVASRGLDIPEVELVLNYCLPPTPKDYIHRVGRTARAGKSGWAISLVTPYDLHLLKDIEDTINTKLKEFKVDSKEVSKLFTQVSVLKRESEIKLDQRDFFEKKAIYKRKQLILEGKISPEDGLYDEVLLRLKSKKSRRKNKKNYSKD